MSDGVIVDTSLAIKWILEEQYAREAKTLLRRWIEGHMTRMVPSWFACEVTNVLLKNIRRGAFEHAHGATALQTLLALTRTVDIEPFVSVRALEIAVALAQPASYDCQYLALAEHLDCDLWTADERFWNATKAAFPRVRWIGEVPEAP